MLGANYLLGEQGGEQGGNLLVEAREQGGRTGRNEKYYRNNYDDEYREEGKILPK